MPNERIAVSVRWPQAGIAAALLCAMACGDDADVPKDAGPGPEEAPPTGKAVWSMMGYDSLNHYVQPDEATLSVGTAAKLKEQWRYTIAGFPAGSPAIANGRVFILSTGGFYAVDLASGQPIWTNMDVLGTASPAYADGYLFVHDVAGQLYKIKAEDGSVAWGPIATYPEQPRCDGTSSPILAGDTVLVGHSCGVPEVTGGDAQKSARGGVEAFTIDSGERLWTYYTVPESGENGAMVWSSVGVDREAGVVFATTGNNYTLVGENSDSIHAIDLGSGERKWKTQVREADLWSLSGGITPTSQDTDFGANPIVADVGDQKLVAAGDKSSAFWALDRETGAILWNRTDLSSSHTPNHGGVLNNGAFDGKSFYVASNQPPDNSVLHVLDPQDGHDVVDPVELGAIVWGMPSLANGLLFVPVNSKLRIFDSATLEQLTEFDTGGTIAAGAPAIADGRIVVKSGLRYQFAPDALANDQVICYGLGEPSEKPNEAAPDAGTTGMATFTGVYNDVIVKTGCLGSALCHGGPTGNLELSSKDAAYDALVEVDAMGMTLPPATTPNCSESGLKRVVKGNPDDSLLMQKLEGKQSCGTEMPPGGKVSDAQLEQVRSWIANGAQND